MAIHPLPSRAQTSHDRQITVLSLSENTSFLEECSSYTHGCQMAKFDPFLSLDCAPALHPGAIQGKEGIKFCYLATLSIAKMPLMAV